MGLGYDKRAGALSLRLQLETKLFYAAAGAFLLEASTTRAVEQFVMARARDRNNVAELAHAIRTRAILAGQTPAQLLAEWLESTGDYTVLENYQSGAIALCTLWGIDPNEIAIQPPTDVG